MGIVVTGVGPRCGTSAMMYRLVNKGYRCIGTKFPRHCIPKHNPQGYWENELSFYDRMTKVSLGEMDCIKLFPGHLHLVDFSTVSLLVVMHRADRENQIKSTIRVGKDEGIHLDYVLARRIIVESEQQLDQFLPWVNYIHVPVTAQDTVEAYL